MSNATIARNQVSESSSKAFRQRGESSDGGKAVVIQILPPLAETYCLSSDIPAQLSDAMAGRRPNRCVPIHDDPADDICLTDEELDSLASSSEGASDWHAEWAQK